ncbi:MAG: adenylate cyclase [Gammaproteobacteria bacterium]|jgi:adenylate cyclase
MSWVELFSGNPVGARAAADEAIKANQSYAVIRVYCGNMYVILGDAHLALDQYDVMRRLSPRDPLLFVADSWAGLGHYVLGNYDETLEWCHRSLRQNENFIYTLVTAIAAYGQLGRSDEAQKHLRSLLNLVPEPSEAFVRNCYPFPDSALIERFLDGLNKAGFPL